MFELFTFICLSVTLFYFYLNFSMSASLHSLCIERLPCKVPFCLTSLMTSFLGACFILALKR